MSEPDPENEQHDLAREFEFLLLKEGIPATPEQRQALLSTYADLKSQIGLLSSTLSPEVEPSTVFHLSKVAE
ncbi:hypothetical protein [Agrobacterium sp. T29]|uniref:hypothetical protein n=1 Tax=Agrobacterium sp. T29 TaxID=2580515 RepID=UPI00115D80D4|nr:hypothetical protein [Agrobacterium sp. T29]